MNDYSRLFEVFEYQKTLGSLDVAIAFKQKDEWKTYTTDDVIDITRKLSLGLIKYGIKLGDKIAIISANNRPEWNFVDIATLQVGAIDVPVYPTISPTDYEYIMNDAEVRLVFVSNRELYDKVMSIKKSVPTLEKIYCFEKEDGIPHYNELMQQPEEGLTDELKKRKTAIKPDDLATIIYTSGTTGQPKGVMLSHHNIIANAKATKKDLPITKGHVVLSFLPLCHIFERMVTYTYFVSGASVYYAESIDKIGENLKEIQPHFFTSVPRLLEKVFDKIVSKGLDLKGIKRALFFWALNLGMKYDWSKNQGWWYNKQLGLANKIVFSKWREALGGRLLGIVTGSAPLQPRLARVFSAAQIDVREGYGLTETSPVLTYNRFDPKDAKIGTVGIPLDNVEMKLADDGEILVKGPNIMQGYYKKPDKTAEVFTDDGWFCTGDIGTMIEGRFLKITDRKKQLMKTSNGKYVAPQPIEEKFKESMLIEQVMVVAEGRKFVSALVVPTFGNLKEWMKDHNIAYTTNEEAIENEKVIAKFYEICEEFNSNFGHTEQVKKIKLMPSEWTEDGGELTPTMKMKRKNICEKHNTKIEEIYT